MNARRTCPCGHRHPLRRHADLPIGSIGAVLTLLWRRPALRKRLPLAHVLDEWART